METEAKERRKRRVKREEGPSRANRIAGREREGRREGRCHGWIPVDYDRNNGIRIIRFMRTDDTYNRPIIITLGKGITMAIKGSMEGVR